MIVSQSRNQKDSGRHMSVRDGIFYLIKTFTCCSPVPGDILDRERGQALVRVFVTATVTVCLMYVHGLSDSRHAAPPWTVIAGYVVLSISFFWYLRHAETSLAWRRYLANVADAFVGSYTMIASGVPAIPKRIRLSCLGHSCGGSFVKSWQTFCSLLRTEL